MSHRCAQAATLAHPKAVKCALMVESSPFSPAGHRDKSPQVACRESRSRGLISPSGLSAAIGAHAVGNGPGESGLPALGAYSACLSPALS